MERFGNENTYQMAPRATIFRRDEANVIDMDSMKYIMRYNGKLTARDQCSAQSVSSMFADITSDYLLSWGAEYSSVVEYPS